MKLNRFVFLFVALQLSLNLFGQVLISEFIFDEAPFPSCHASTICSTDDGPMVAWFGGTHEKHMDVGIWVARKHDRVWTKPQEVANGIQHQDKRYPCWNPVLYQDPSGMISLYYKVGPSPSEWWGMLIQSHDNGNTWTIPRRLPEDILGPVKNKPILLQNETLMHLPVRKMMDGKSTWKSPICKD